MTATAAKPQGRLFKAPMVVALLNTKVGSWPAEPINPDSPFKWQSRRLITHANSLVDGSHCSKDLWAKLFFDSHGAYVDKGPSPAGNPGPYLHVPHCDGETTHRVYPRTQVGEQWYVKETHALTDESINCQPGYVYRATDPDWGTMEGFKWKPSIFMPAEASRIHLEVTQVRVQRLQDIGKDGRLAKDVLAEGVSQQQIEHWAEYLHPDDAPAHTFGVLWDSINKDAPWASNPWCFAYSFKRIE